MKLPTTTYTITKMLKFINTSHILYTIHHSFQNLKSESKIKAMKTKTKDEVCNLQRCLYSEPYSEPHSITISSVP